jgi:hypothetical protein
MPWKETTQVQARIRFIEDWLAKEHESLAVLCRLHGVSRKTGYKWVGRVLANDRFRPGSPGNTRRRPASAHPSCVSAPFEHVGGIPLAAVHF